MRRALTRVAALIALVATLLAGGLMCSRVGARGRYVTPYSTYGAGKHGARAVFDLTRSLGYRSERWVEDLARLPEGAVLVALGGCRAEMRRSLSLYERTSLLEWVERGGTLIVAGAAAYLPPPDAEDASSPLVSADGGTDGGVSPDAVARPGSSTWPIHPPSCARTMRSQCPRRDHRSARNRSDASGRGRGRAG